MRTPILPAVVLSLLTACQVDVSDPKGMPPGPDDTQSDDMAPDCTWLLDLDTDGDGAAISAGQDVEEAYAAWGVHIGPWSLGGDTAGLGIAFDSSSPPGTDYDLGTPNETYGGPGTGDGGASNDRAMGNLLIRAESTEDADGDGLVDIPDDHVDGVRFLIDFDEHVCVTTLELLDIDEGDASVNVANAGGKLLGISVSGGGDNSRVTVDVNTCDLSRLTIELLGSGAVDEVGICRFP